MNVPWLLKDGWTDAENSSFVLNWDQSVYLPFGPKMFRVQSSAVLGDKKSAVVVLCISNNIQWEINTLYHPKPVYR